MNPTMYYLGIFLVGLGMAMAVFPGLIYLLSEQSIYLNPLSKFWLALSIILHLALTFVTLKYYQHKKFWYAFYSSSAVSLATFYNLILLFSLLIRIDILSFYITSVLLVLGTLLFYALSLIFSLAATRPWLKAFGILMCLFVLTLIPMFIIGKDETQFMRSKGNLYENYVWISICVSLLPVFHIMNFRNELKAFSVESYKTTIPHRLQKILSVFAIIVFFTSLILSYGVAKHYLAGPKVRKLALAYEARTFENDHGEALSFRLMKPIDYDPKKKYPVVVSLHGGGAIGKDNMKQIHGSIMPQLLSKDENRIKFPAFLFVPQFPPGASWGGPPHKQEIGLLILEAISELESEFRIDPNRRYITGYSMGGYGAWHMITNYPEKFAAAIPISCGGDPSIASKIVDIPIWVFHGTNDKSVPISKPRAMIDAIKKEGGNPLFTEFPNSGHAIRSEVVSTPGLLEWLFAQKRE